MTSVGVVVRRGSLRSHKIHDLVLSFSWDRGIRNDDFQLSELARFIGTNKEIKTYIFPTRVSVELVGDPIPQRGSKDIHEGRSWRDDVAVPRLLHNLLPNQLLAGFRSMLLGKHFVKFLLLLIILLRFLR